MSSNFLLIQVLFDQRLKELSVRIKCYLFSFEKLQLSFNISLFERIWIQCLTIFWWRSTQSSGQVLVWQNRIFIDKTGWLRGSNSWRFSKIKRNSNVDCFLVWFLQFWNLWSRCDVKVGHHKIWRLWVKTRQCLNWSSKWNKHSVTDFLMCWNLKMLDI